MGISTTNSEVDEMTRVVLMRYRSDGEAIAVNLPDLEPVETPEGVKWIDPTHANLPDHHHHGHSHGHDHSH